MKRTITHKQYLKANPRLEKLIDLVDDNTPADAPLTKEFLEICDIIEEYESVHFPMEAQINRVKTK